MACVLLCVSLCDSEVKVVSPHMWRPQIGGLELDIWKDIQSDSQQF